ncbi:hypothetical protein GI584_23205 [Gracilibacillus salitolerans]|uniref:Gas vesicle protein n=1 Tax=Gracilibacillus salitolerans TaxID=2663022 RepID=A0A5Q2TRP3_9BACI|nr:hypothetical protein [Gracilibacillus salitolerans]QGH36782.1 hypothetical protein GI584_23205 [Gracilibacillus salitolerans]
MAEQEIQQSKNQDSSQGSIGYILMGGVVGAGVGLLSIPGTAQKLYRRVQHSETGQIIAKELCRNVQQLIAHQAMAVVQQAAPDYLNKAKNRLSGKSSHESEQNRTEEDSQYEVVKQENKQINQRLDQIEKKLDELLHVND